MFSSTPSPHQDEATEPLLSGDRTDEVSEDSLKHVDIEAQCTEAPSFAPNEALTEVAAAAGPNEEVMEALRLERAIILVSLAILSHAAMTSGVLDHVMKSNHHAIFGWVNYIYIWISLFSCLYLTIYVRGEAPEAQVHICRTLSKCGFIAWSQLILTTVSLGLVISAFILFGFYKELLLLALGLSTSLIVAVCTLGNVAPMSPSVHSFFAYALAPGSLQSYEGLYFPFFFYAAIPDFVLAKQTHILLLLSGALMAGAGVFLCRPVCTDWVNRYTGNYAIFNIVIVALMIL